MTKLESYMVGGQFTATQFLAEVDGHPDDPPVRNALEELAFFTTDVKVLGVYPADPFRAESATWPSVARVTQTTGRPTTGPPTSASPAWTSTARPAPATPRWCTAPARRPRSWSRS